MEANLRRKFEVVIVVGFFSFVGFCVGGSSDGDPDGREASG